jgi:hypothetical protein
LREIEARSVDPAVYEMGTGATRPPRAPAPQAAGRPTGVFLDLPLLRGDEPAHAGYFAAAQSPWPTAVALYRSATGTGYTLKALVSAPAIMGRTLGPLPTGPLARLDRATRLSVRLDGGELASVPRTQMLGGANAAAIENADGEWEVVQFETATLIATRTYELSGLLRGQAGTEAAMRAPLAAGARFVLLTPEVTRVDMTPDEIGLPFTWRFGPAGRDVGDATYDQRQHAFRGQGIEPLSPAHLRGSRSGGDLTITWVRRTRINGDSWEAVEVPLGEDQERYEVDILDGGTVKRTLAATSPSATYTAAQQVADFGSAQPVMAVRIYQLGTVAGRGTPRSATV